MQHATFRRVGLQGAITWVHDAPTLPCPNTLGPPPLRPLWVCCRDLGPPPCTYFGFAAAILCSSLSVSNVVYSMLCSAAYLMSLGRLQGCAKMMRD